MCLLALRGKRWDSYKFNSWDWLNVIWVLQPFLTSPKQSQTYQIHFQCRSHTFSEMACCMFSKSLVGQKDLRAGSYKLTRPSVNFCSHCRSEPLSSFMWGVWNPWIWCHRNKRLYSAKLLILCHILSLEDSMPSCSSSDCHTSLAHFKL